MPVAWPVGHQRGRKRSTQAPGLTEIQQRGRNAPGHSQRAKGSEPPPALLTAHPSSQGTERPRKYPPHGCPGHPLGGNGPRAASGRYGLLAAPEAGKCCPSSFTSFNNFSPGAPFLSHRDCSDPRAWEPGREEGSCLPRLLKLIAGGCDLSGEEEECVAAEHCSAETAGMRGER